MFAERYFNEINRILQKVYDTQIENIKSAAQMIVNASLKGNRIYAFGSNHAGLLALEMFYRSGGLAIINPICPPGLTLDVIPVTLATEIERLENYGGIIIKKYGLKAGDVFIIHSVSGRNNVSIDMSLKAGELGAKVIAITNMEYSKDVSSRHKSGKRLFETAHLVIDNCGCIGDAAIEAEGLPYKVAPTSTAVGAAIVNAIVAEVIALYLEKGITPPVFVSSNMDNGDIHNEKILNLYRKNIKYSY